MHTIYVFGGGGVSSGWKGVITSGKVQQRGHINVEIMILAEDRYAKLMVELGLCDFNGRKNKSQLITFTFV